jgi:hypothetical protein
MVTGSSMFAFTPNERTQLLSVIGRGDISTLGFIGDVEACLQAFDYSATGGMSRGLPTAIAEHLSNVVHLAAQLRSALYGLPSDVAMLIDLHLLSDGARRRIACDLSMLVEPLEDIAGAILQIQRAAEGDALAENVRLEDRLVRAIAVVFRNRLNRKPTPEDNSRFPATLAQILEFAGHRMPRIAAVRAAVTPARLRALLA